MGHREVRACPHLPRLLRNCNKFDLHVVRRQNNATIFSPQARNSNILPLLVKSWHIRTWSKLFLAIVFLFLVGCARPGSEPREVPEYSSQNFKVFVNDEFPQKLDEQPGVQEVANMLEEFELPYSRSIIEWDPDGAYENPVEEKCLYTHLDYLFSIPNLTNKSRAQAIQNWVNRCQDQLSLKTNRFITLLKFETVHYNMIENKNLSKVKITLKDGTILRGILGIKNDGIKRPLILIQSGVYSNADDSGANRNFIMQIFDEGPFNILLLNNMTGSEYLKDNRQLAIGGVEEGRHIIEVAQMLRSATSPLQNFVTSIHLLGVSLGSHSALYASLYNSYLDDPPIQSVMAYCPVVNLEPTLESTFDRSFRGYFYHKQTARVFKKSFDFVPVIGDLFGKPQTWTRETTLLAIKKAAYEYYKNATLNKTWGQKPFQDVVFKNPEDVWSLNNFMNQSNKVKTPTMLVYSGDDYFVLPKINSTALSQELSSDPNPNIGIIRFDTGNHCATSVANGWPTISTLLRSYFMSQIFEKQTYESGSIDISRYMNYKLNENQTVVKTAWTINKNNLNLNMNLFDQSIDNCDMRKPFAARAPRYCYHQGVFEIPMQVLEQFGVSLEFNKDALIRWMNTHIVVLDKEGDNIIGKNTAPKKLLIHGNYEY